VIAIENSRSANKAADELANTEKVIPWAEGNGLWGIIAGLVSDLAGMDLATFFVQNPYTCDCAESLAGRIGRPVEEVEPVLEGFAQAELLNAMDLGNLRIYELTGDPHRRQTLQQYVAWLQEGYHWTRMVLEPEVQSVPTPS
jgi:hypothetical protein